MIPLLALLPTRRSSDVEAFRTALRLQGTFSAAGLNLALVLFQLRRFQLALEAYRQVRSDEHTSELQSLTNLVCRLLLEKKNYYHTKLNRSRMSRPTQIY